MRQSGHSNNSDNLKFLPLKFGQKRLCLISCQLTLKEKFVSLQSLDEGKTVRQVAEKFHVPNSTICDIQTNNEKTWLKH